jgi:dihydroneopterin aldolase
MTPLDLSRCDKISGIAFGYDAHVGCTAEERATPQRIEIDFDLFTDWRAAAAIDRIDAPGVLDYARVNDDLLALLASREWHLIETIAEQSARAICQGYAVQAVRVRVVKGPTYLPNVRAVSAECWRSPADYAP